MPQDARDWVVEYPRTLIALGALMLPKDFWPADWSVVSVLVIAAAWYFAVLRGRLARGEAGVEHLMAGTPAAR